MAPDPTNVLQGTLDVMILKSLSVQEMHGLGISRRITQITQGTFQVKKRWGRISLAIARALEAS